jgi:hypothetical protein
MSAAPRRFLALLTRGQLAEMLAPTYAALRNVDTNEAHARLEPALRDLRLIEGLQRETWRALRTAKTKLEEEELLDLVAKKLGKARRFKAAKAKGAGEGALAAVIVLVDTGAGVSSGEAFALLDTREGEALLERGLAILGDHLAAELLR